MKYIVGFSGGIDSVFVSWYLKQKGHDVILVHLKNTVDPNKCCHPPLELFKQAQALGLDIKIIDVIKEFKKEVIQDFIEQYQHWFTPNPCINCNQKVRWKVLEKIRVQLGADKIATWHYAQISKLENGLLTLKAALDPKKEQTYMLRKIIFNKASDGKQLLNYVQFPAGHFTKKDIKKEVKKQGLPIISTQESQNICFVPDDDYPRFIRQHSNTPIPTGPIKHIKTNKYLGEHKGLIYYTIGQRRWLGLQADPPLYVIKIDTSNNTLWVGEEKYLYHTNILVKKLNMLYFDNNSILKGKIRYHWELIPVKKINSQSNQIIFEKPHRAPTPWQHLVLYDQEGRVVWGWEISTKIYENL